MVHLKKVAGDHDRVYYPTYKAALLDESQPTLAQCLKPFPANIHPKYPTCEYQLLLDTHCCEHERVCMGLLDQKSFNFISFFIRKWLFFDLRMRSVAQNQSIFIINILKLLIKTCVAQNKRHWVIKGMVIKSSFDHCHEN